MKRAILLIALLVLIFCKSSVAQTQYSENELIAFLDSIGQLNPDAWVEESFYDVDSTLYGQTTLNQELTTSDFEKLKKAAKEQLIDIDLAKRIFPELNIDTTYAVGKWNKLLPIEFHSFDINKDDFNKFAIVIGYGSGISTDNDVYFFQGKKVIAKHSIYYRYELELNHFKDENDRTVIFYNVCYQSGTGIWWYQFNFYCYDNEILTPVLTEIQNINLQPYWWIREYWIESEIVNERPLQIKFVYYNQFYETDTVDDISMIDFINDSTIVTYHIDTQNGKFIPDFNGTKQNRNKLLSYFHSANELLFANSHYDLFKNGLNGTDPIMRKAILNYLNDLMEFAQEQK
jgi:hypothetical protein